MAYTTINKSTDNFRIKLYTGNQTAKSLTFDESGNMQPDLVWIKPRDNGSWSHLLHDSVRGAGKAIYPDLNNLEYNYGTGTDGSVRTFDTNGFSIGTPTQVNNNSSNIIAWCWKGTGSTASNSNGSITSTVSANTTAGLSIVKYDANNTTGATVGHGLGVIPKVIIIKEIAGSANDWVVYHERVGNTKKLILNENNASSIDNFMNDATPTATTFSISNASVVNRSGSTYIAYCFAEKTGYSKFGSYTGNSSTDGTFIYTGFKPSWVMWKKYNASEDWGISDNKRDTFNVMTNKLRPNSNIAEVGSQDHLDFVSNGFKWRSTSGEFNTNGHTYIYMAFGQSLVGSNNVPCTAR